MGAPAYQRSMPASPWFQIAAQTRVVEHLDWRTERIHRRHARGMRLRNDGWNGPDSSTGSNRSGGERWLNHRPTQHDGGE